MLSVSDAQALVQRLVEHSTASGADAADAIYAGGTSSSVEVRLRELEGVSRSEDQEVGLRVFIGQKSATVSSSELSRESLDELVRRALAMAAEAPEDPFAGLALEALLARGPFADLEAFDAVEPEPSDLRARALAAEEAALGVAGVTNSTGASASASSSGIALATSGGFVGGYRTSGFSCSAGVVAGEGGGMQRDSAWHSARHLDDLEAPDDLGRKAGERAVARLNPGRIESGPMPVLFDPRVASSLLGHLAGAINGASIARKSSFLQDKLGSLVFAPGVSIVDDPLRRRGLRSRPFDGEGVGVARQEIIADGVLQTWLADSAAARQLGIAPTGHAARGVGGSPSASPSNFYMAAGKRSREQLLAAFPHALLVTELIGMGVNGVTGDYSRGAAGFIVSGGEIGPAVQEITIAANLIEMFATLEPGSDLEFRRGVDAPTVLVPQMMVAAA
ncbi:TldD/PmbA family protein [Sphingomonas sinipercae]|uniref:TldD/PmbA family protein n=1 Tax=Sphingomonas sinipercae TaxID=2714944 RepID=A0A6G7ZQC0_9SPHN|nr:metallopeptidase TldD-related protein [Sphingomonas sinipercae]QIL03128.1 TldD/PmbA family protein [Sphingomonas sinipercae]